MDLHWLPVSKRIAFKILLLTYKALHGQGPVYLRDCLAFYKPQRSLRSANELLLSVPKSRLRTYGERAFQVAAPRLWNKLPLDIRQSPSTESFKNRLKTHFFKGEYSC